MGAGNSTYSTAINNVINESVNNISSDIRNICASTNANKQSVNISLDKVTNCQNINIVGISQSITATSTLDCKSANIDSLSLETIIKNNVEANAKTMKDSPFFSFGDKAASESVNKVVNSIVSNINLSKIAENVASQLNDQNIAINIKEWTCTPYRNKNGNYVKTELNIKNLNQDILNNVVLKAFSQNQTVIDTLTTADNELKASADATSLGMTSAMLGIFLGLFGFIILIIFFVVIFKMLKKSVGKTGSNLLNIFKGQKGQQGSVDSASNQNTGDLHIPGDIARESEITIKGLDTSKTGFGTTQKTTNYLTLAYLVTSIGMIAWSFVNVSRLDGRSDQMNGIYSVMAIAVVLMILNIVFLLKSNTPDWALHTLGISNMIMWTVLGVYTHTEFEKFKLSVEDNMSP